MIDHQFPGGAPRCIYCGTRAIHHAAIPQPCPGPQVQRGEKLRPEPARREYAVNDADTIHARLAELEAERIEALNVPPDENGQALGGPVEEGGIQH